MRVDRKIIPKVYCTYSCDILKIPIVGSLEFSHGWWPEEGGIN